MDGVADGAGAADCPGGAVEDGEEAVARHVDFPPAEAFELPPGDADVSVEHFPPRAAGPAPALPAGLRPQTRLGGNPVTDLSRGGAQAPCFEA